MMDSEKTIECMGDVRFNQTYQQVTESSNRAAFIHAMSDTEIVAALAGAVKADDPYIANVLATESQNRFGQHESKLSDVQSSLQEVQVLFETVFKSARTMFAVVDSEFRFVQVNPAYATITGNSEAWHQGKCIFDVFPDPQLPSIFKAALGEGKSYERFGVPSRTPGVDGRWDWTLKPLVGPDGGFDRLLIEVARGQPPNQGRFVEEPQAHAQ